MKCKKCGNTSGNDWSECGNICPMSMSPHYPLESFYINNNVEKTLELTGLAIDELESIVGRFAKHSHRAGLLRGKVVITKEGYLQIRKSFGNTLLWQSPEPLFLDEPLF